MKEKIRRRNPSCCALEEMVEWNNKAKKTKKNSIN